MQVIGAIGGLLGLGVKAIFGGGKPAAPIQPLPTVTRDDAASAQSAQDALLRRRGAAADMLTGTRGAEAAAGSTGKLMITGN